MRIGYYAHHHGSGHCRQADKLAALLPLELRQQMTVFTSLAIDDYRFTTLSDTQIIRLSAEDQLPDEVLAGRAGVYWQPSSLHYSPVGNSNIQNRSWQLLDTIKQRHIDVMVIDVSVEIAMLCRAASVPYLYVRLAGERDDLPHLSAFAGALGLLAPYPQMLEAAKTPEWVRHKTLYLDFLPMTTTEPLSRKAFLHLLTSLLPHPDSAIPSKSQQQIIDQKDNNQSLPLVVTVIKGYGGHEAIDATLLELRCVLPDALIVSLGPIGDDKRKYTDIATQVDDVTPFIAHSDLLLMACGLNGIAQVYGWKTPLVVLPDARPHREQEVMAEALISNGRAVSWQQFIERMHQAHDSNSSITQAIHSLSNNARCYTPSKLNTASTAAAQAFMTSIAGYTSIKVWFREWLLPQLGIDPDNR